MVDNCLRLYQKLIKVAVKITNKDEHNVVSPDFRIRKYIIASTSVNELTFS